jgi:peptidoglycan/xylan/chitin deacetylase (PgdA/CDA1 family)
MSATGVMVTTSWDDGHRLDRRLGDLLDRHGLAATFYVAPKNAELEAGDRLGSDGVRDLDGRFEIGGHTLTHPRLSAISLEEGAREISDGKEALESTLGHPLVSFCYPSGDYRPEHIDAVRTAGFSLARTVERFSVALPADIFQTPTTVHAYRHLVDGPAAAQLAGYRPFTAARLYWDWDRLAIAMFEKVAAVGGVYHLWGHSWEIDRHGDWDRLERVLAHLGGRVDVDYVTNGDLVSARSR